MATKKADGDEVGSRVSCRMFPSESMPKHSQCHALTLTHSCTPLAAMAL